MSASLAGEDRARYDPRVTLPCALCDQPTDGDEALCASCLADPEQRAAYEADVSAARAASAISRYFTAARDAVAMARAYRLEARLNDARVAACIDEARRCRDAIARIRAGERPSVRPGPGLRKAGVTPAHAAEAAEAAGAGAAAGAPRRRE